MPSKLTTNADYISLLQTLHRTHTTSLHSALLSTLARPALPDPSSSSSSTPVVLPPVIPSSTFTLFPLFPSATPASLSPFTIQDELLTLADACLPGDDGVREEDQQTLILGAMKGLEGVLMLLAEDSPVERQFRVSRRKKARRVEKAKAEVGEEDNGWETVVRVCNGKGGVQDEVMRRTKARLEALYGDSVALTKPKPRVPAPDSGVLPPLPGRKRRPKGSVPKRETRKQKAERLAEEALTAGQAPQGTEGVPVRMDVEGGDEAMNEKGDVAEGVKGEESGKED